MPVSAFPLRSVLLPIYEEEEAPKRPITKSPEFADGGVDFNIAPIAAKTRRFRLLYGQLTAAEAATLDAHMDEAKYDDDEGSALSFQFTTRSGEVLAGVRYAPGGYRRDHIKTWINSREIILIDRP